MAKVALYRMDGTQVGEFELRDDVFGIEPNEHVLHSAVVMQLAGRRLGTHATKNRARVRGGGKKPWRQKGTGRARHGSIRSPIWVGGGTVFGPTPRSYAIKLPKKVRRLAIKSALSAKVRDNQCLVLEELKMERPRTKDMVNVLKNLNLDKKALFVSENPDENLILSARNIPGVKVVGIDGINVLDVLHHDQLILTKEAAVKVGEVLGG
ncbi:MAG: 50S ribosomal protein L4 [Bacillus thermozeamaize]|uniref:Large ribosomal subunit protein uL4 n=1 Tax=Bacillus thermozeamaize TaxID=230954 RepID=A0A1Y3PUJ1_9BACI|nr:MAG: 50S ribosomal protein L4 [Bacillus thermozeamaize]